MRAISRPLAQRAASNPIETIVCTFIVSTLAYFQILSAIRHSAFLSPSLPTPIRAAHVVLRDGDWITTSDRAWFNTQSKNDAVDLQQIVFSLDAPSSSKEGKGSSPDVRVSLISLQFYTDQHFPCLAGGQHAIHGNYTHCRIHGKHHPSPHPRFAIHNQQILSVAVLPCFLY